MNDFLFPKEKAFNNSSCFTSERLFLTTLYKANSPNSSLITLHLSLFLSHYPTFITFMALIIISSLYIPSLEYKLYEDWDLIFLLL